MNYLYLKVKATRIVEAENSKYYPIQTMIETIVPENFTNNGESVMQLIKETCRGSVALPTMVEAMQILDMNVNLMIKQKKLTTSYTTVYNMKKADMTGVKLSIAVKKLDKGR